MDLLLGNNKQALKKHGIGFVENNDISSQKPDIVESKFILELNSHSG